MSLDTSFIQKESVIRLFCRVYPSQVKFLDIVAKEGNITRSEALRMIIAKFSKAYFHKKGTFICQCCGNPRNNKERHEVPVDNDVFVFGDCCFYNDKYKEKLRGVI